MSPVTRKPVFGVCDQVRLEPACSATETSLRLEISDIETKDIILSRQWTTKSLIRLRGCAGWSASLLFAYGINRFSHDKAHMCFDDVFLTGLYRNINSNECELWWAYLNIEWKKKQVHEKYAVLIHCILNILVQTKVSVINITRGARWRSGRVSDSGARGRGFETYRRRVVSLSKTLYSPKVLVNYPGSYGSVPTWLKNCWLGR